MTKLTLPEIQSGYVSAEKINTAFQQIEDAIDNTLSRDGTTPNTMEASLDMNSNRILNLPDPSSDSEPVTYGAAKALANGWVLQTVEMFTATAGQTAFVLSDSVYQVGANNIAAYVNGVRKFIPDYAETDSSTITFSTPLAGGEEVVLVTNDFIANIDTTAPSSVSWSIVTGIPSYAKRWPTWTEVTGKPTEFDPTSHVHSATEITSGGLADAQRRVYVQSGAPTGLGAGDAGALWFW